MKKIIKKIKNGENVGWDRKEKRRKEGRIEKILRIE